MKRKVVNVFRCVSVSRLLVLFGVLAALSSYFGGMKLWMKPSSVFFLYIFSFSSLYQIVVVFRLRPVLAFFLSHVVNVLAVELSQDPYVPIQAMAVTSNVCQALLPFHPLRSQVGW